MNGGPAAGGGHAAVRPRSAVAALVAAAALGLATGRFVLPPPPGATAHPAERSGAAVGGASQGASAPATPGGSVPTPASPASGSGSASPTGATGATGPVTTANLLGPAAFSPDLGIGRIHVTDRYGDGSYANAACAGEKTLTQTLGGPGAHFRGLMTSPRTGPDDPTVAADSGGQVAREVAADARSPSLAQNYSERLLLEEVPCQEQAPGHWVYGKTTTLQLAPDVTARWMGVYQGSLNTTGSAPEGKEPCGGIAVLRSGNHYGVLEVHACLGTAAMDRVVRTALSQL